MGLEHDGASGEKDAAALLKVSKEMLSMGREAKQMAVEWAGYLRDVMLYQAAPGMKNGRTAVAACEKSFGRTCKTPIPKCDHAARVRRLGEAIQEARWAVDARIPLEMALLALCRGEAENGDWDGRRNGCRL